MYCVSISDVSELMGHCRHFSVIGFHWRMYSSWNHQCQQIQHEYILNTFWLQFQYILSPDEICIIQIQYISITSKQGLVHHDYYDHSVKPGYSWRHCCILLACRTTWVLLSLAASDWQGSAGPAGACTTSRGAGRTAAAAGPAGGRRRPPWPPASLSCRVDGRASFTESKSRDSATASLRGGKTWTCQSWRAKGSRPGSLTANETERLRRHSAGGPAARRQNLKFPSAKWAVHIYYQYAKSEHCTILHIVFGVCILFCIFKDISAE
jgi:hypothetical protein